MSRARRSLVVLVAVAAAALGTLTRALGWTPGPAAGLTVAACGVLLVVAVALALRVVAALAPRRQLGERR